LRFRSQWTIEEPVEVSFSHAIRHRNLSAKTPTANSQRYPRADVAGAMAEVGGRQLWRPRRSCSAAAAARITRRRSTP
jgi:hypothetical protein